MSSLADTIFCPSGLNCADFTQSLCPSSVYSWPSGLNCAEFTASLWPRS
eukprot:SAG22_NODE_6515_length_844_cov_1.518121_2_plen_49_part_00